MIKQNELSQAAGAKRSRKRVGRGNGSGHGTYSGKGLKGQKSRSGANVRPGFEGGQLPLIKRLPRKRGFTNIFRTEYSVVNLSQLGVFAEGTEVTREAMVAAGLVKNLARPVKILADGDIKTALTVKADRFSSQAKARIEAAGGKTEEVAGAAKAE